MTVLWPCVVSGVAVSHVVRGDVVLPGVPGPHASRLQPHRHLRVLPQRTNHVHVVRVRIHIPHCRYRSVRGSVPRWGGSTWGYVHTFLWCLDTGDTVERRAGGATIRYDTRCYFNVRSKADMRQLNLPHGTDN